jgi:hypothetical protein
MEKGPMVDEENHQQINEHDDSTQPQQEFLTFAMDIHDSFFTWLQMVRFFATDVFSPRHSANTS